MNTKAHVTWWLVYYGIHFNTEAHVRDKSYFVKDHSDLKKTFFLKLTLSRCLISWLTTYLSRLEDVFSTDCRRSNGNQFSWNHPFVNFMDAITTWLAVSVSQMISGIFLTSYLQSPSFFVNVIYRIRLFTWFVIRRVPNVEQDLLTLPEHLRSPVYEGFVLLSF